MTTFDEIRESVVQLAKEGDASFLELGRALTEFLNHVNLYDGPPVGEQLADVLKQAGLTRRKAYYLISIHRAFRHLEVSNKRLGAIGWTKLAMLADYVELGSVDAYLTAVEQCSVEQLKAVLKKKNPRPFGMMFKFTAPQFNIVKSALLKHGAFTTESGITNKEQALLDICDLAAEAEGASVH